MTGSKECSSMALKTKEAWVACSVGFKNERVG